MNSPLPIRLSINLKLLVTHLIRNSTPSCISPSRTMQIGETARNIWRPVRYLKISKKLKTPRVMMSSLG